MLNQNKYRNCLIISGALLLFSLIEMIVFACVRLQNYGIIDMQLYSGIVLACIAGGAVVLAVTRRKSKARYYDFIIIFVGFAFWLGTFIQQTLNGRTWSNPYLIYEKFISYYNGLYYNYVCIEYNRLIPSEISGVTGGNIYSFNQILSLIFISVFTVLFVNDNRKRHYEFNNTEKQNKIQQET